MRLSNFNRRARTRGVTLIELMVAMAISLILALVTVAIERSLALQKTRGADTALRDNDSRASMDVITHDLSSAGFLFSVTSQPCYALFTYNGAVAGFYTHYPVDAIAAASGAAMPFATALTLNYPVGGTPPSDVLILTGSSDSAGFNDQTAPVVTALANVVYDPNTSPILPITTTIGLTPGDVGLVEVPLNGKRACMRVPISGVGAGAGSSIMSSAGPLIPPAAYGGFGLQMAAAGLGTGLPDAAIYQGVLVDMGPPVPLAPAVINETTTAYYIDDSGAWPVLMRSTYSLLDDTPIGPPQQIAAGVVSLQVLFGVDPGLTGGVTAYENGATVRASVHQDFILTVRIALVVRSLYADPDPNFVNPTALVKIGNGFANVPIPAAYMNYRWMVQQTEVALRNCQWQQC